jgi:hypothetical protein
MRLVNKETPFGECCSIGSDYIGAVKVVEIMILVVDNIPNDIKALHEEDDFIELIKFFE